MAKRPALRLKETPRVPFARLQRAFTKHSGLPTDTYRRYVLRAEFPMLLHFIARDPDLYQAFCADAAEACQETYPQ